MSVTFTKLFSSITESTVWCEPDRTRLVWITMLAMADWNGRIWASVPGLANRARVPVEDAESALQTFLAPDRYSRTPDHDGRRIEPIEGGWRLLNYTKYRELRDQATRREQNRQAKQRQRKSAKTLTVSQGQPLSAHAEAEVDTEADTEANPDTEAKTEKRKKRVAEPSATAPLREAYSLAYLNRYGTEPIWNSKTNSQIKEVLRRLGQEAVPVASFYLTHNGSFYASRMHPVGLLLNDAEKLRTEWATGRTASNGRSVADHNRDVLSEIIRGANGKG